MVFLHDGGTTYFFMIYFLNKSWQTVRNYAIYVEPGFLNFYATPYNHPWASPKPPSSSQRVLSYAKKWRFWYAMVERIWKGKKKKTIYLLQHDSAWLQGTSRYYKVRVIVSRGLSWSTGVFWGAAQAITHAWADSTDTAKSLLWLSCNRFVTINFNRQTLHQRGRWASPTFWLTFVVSVRASLG